MREKGRRIVEGDAATKNCLWHTDVELSFPFYVVLFSSFNDICELPYRELERRIGVIP